MDFLHMDLHLYLYYVRGIPDDKKKLVSWYASCIYLYDHSSSDKKIVGRGVGGKVGAVAC